MCLLWIGARWRLLKGKRHLAEGVSRYSNSGTAVAVVVYKVFALSLRYRAARSLFVSPPIWMTTYFAGPSPIFFTACSVP